MRRRTTVWILMVPLALAALAGACSSGDDRAATATSADADRSGAPSGPPVPVEDAWVELLRHTPDTEAIRASITLVDVARLAQAAGLDFPLTEADRDELIAFTIETGAISNTSPFLRVPLPSDVESDEPEDYDVGFDLYDVAATLDAEAGLNTFRAAIGAFDADEVRASIADHPYWGDLLEITDDASGVRLSFGAEDGRITGDLDAPWTLDGLGRPVHLLVEPSLARLSSTEATMDQSVAAAEGDDALGDNAPAGDVVGALDDSGAFSALLILDPREYFDPDGLRLCGIGCDEEQRREMQEREAVTTIEPWLAFGIGLAGSADDGFEIVLAFAHEDAAQAEANAELLRTAFTDDVRVSSWSPWSEVVSVERATAERTTTVVRLAVHDGPPNLWLSALAKREWPIYWS